MKKLTALMGGVVLATAGSFSHAAEEGAGCGISTLLFEGQSGKVPNIASSVLNGAIDTFIFTLSFGSSPLKTFFMTTGNGTLGCDVTQEVRVEEVREIFVAQNMDQLTTETAQGNGDHLTVLAALLGVPESEIPHFSDMAQAHFDSLFMSGNDAADVIASLQTAMADDQQLAPFAVN